MKKLLLSIFVACLIPSLILAQAEPNHIGWDILGLAKQDTKTIIESMEGPVAIGALQGTFGNIHQNLKKLLATGNVTAVRVHMLNGPCWRNRRCEAGEPAVTDYKAIATRAKDIADIMKSYPKVRCFVSPVLEHDVKDQNVVNTWFKVLKEVAPNCKAVCNPFLGWCPNGVLKEKHGNNPGYHDIVSNDGASIFQSDSLKYRKFGKNINFAWYWEMNLLYEGLEGFIVPSKRTCKSTKALYKQSYRLLKEPKYNEIVPASCKTVVGFDNKQLLKTNAESYCNSDNRGNKPLLILNKKYSGDLEVLGPKGKKVGCAKYYGLYENKQYRYYVGSCSGESPVDLMDEVGGQERLFYRASDGTCFKANAIRRQGYYK